MNRRKNKSKRKLSIHKIAGLILFLFSIILCTLITMLNILPSKYYSLMLIIFLIINIPLDISLFKKKSKKRKKNIALGLCLALIMIMIIPILYMGKTLAFLWRINYTDYKIENYSVIVLEDSSYLDISDINNLSVGFYANTDGINQAKEELLKKINITYQSYNNLDDICKELLEKKVEVILIEDSIYSMIIEDNPNFESSTKVIYTFSIKLESINNAKDVNVSSDPFNIYITGIDTYGDISSVSRSDVNIVMTVNPNTKQILLTSIPRDYYVELHGKQGNKDKLTHAGIYGTDMSIDTIEDLLDIEINYYIKVNFTSFINIIDSIGGIEVYSKYKFTSIDNIQYNEGYNKLNGAEALSFARERKAFAEGDRQRGADQQAVIEAIIKKVCSKSILTKYDSLLNSIEGQFQTNMSYKKITSLIKMQLNDMATWHVISISLDGYDGLEYTYTGGNQKLYVMIPNDDTIDVASAQIQAVLNGEKIDGEYIVNNKKSTKNSKKSTTTVNNSYQSTKNNQIETTKQIELENKKEKITKEEQENDITKSTSENTGSFITDNEEENIEIIIEQENDRNILEDNKDEESVIDEVEKEQQDSQSSEEKNEKVKGNNALIEDTND